MTTDSKSSATQREIRFRRKGEARVWNSERDGTARATDGEYERAPRATTSVEERAPAPAPEQLDLPTPAEVDALIAGLRRATPFDAAQRPPPRRDEVTLAREVAGALATSKRQTERQLGAERRERGGRRGRKPYDWRKARRARLDAEASTREVRRRRQEAKRERFLEAMRRRGEQLGNGACECAPRDFLGRVWRMCSMLNRDLDGVVTRRLAGELPRPLARALRRAALEPREVTDPATGEVRTLTRTWADVVARHRVAIGWTLYRMSVLTYKHGFGRVAAGFSRGMLAQLFRNAKGEPYSVSYIAATSCGSAGGSVGPLEALERAGFMVRKQMPRELRAKYPAYYGPSGYGFNTYWFRDAGEGDDAGDDAGDDDPLERAPLASRAARRERPPPD